MRAIRINLIIEHDGINYNGWVKYGEHGNSQVAKTILELEEKVRKYFQTNYELNNIVLVCKYDLSAMEDVLDIFNISAFARFLDLNPSLLRQYVTGIKHPSEKQLDKILNGFYGIVQRMNKISLALDGKPIIDSSEELIIS
jgi:hypothetical protein